MELAKYMQYNTWATTFRYPQDSSPNTASQDSLANVAIGSQLQAIRGQIRYIFNSLSTFGPFSNNIWTPGNPRTYPSLEDIHDNIHVLVGGPAPSNQSAPAGNMSIIPYAAFDPCFWMHHW
jgi:tyrosinase